MPNGRVPKYLITISGLPGAGKGTTAALLSKKLKIPAYSIGDIRRNLARAKGMTLEEYNVYGESHPETDVEPDCWAKHQAKKTGVGIFDGRVMFHFIPQSVKVFLDCDFTVGAQRIMRDQNEKRHREADFSTLRKAKTALERRKASDTRRYQRFYGVDVFDPRHYDLIIDTTHLTPGQVVRAITDFLAKRARVNKPGMKKVNVNNRRRVIHKISKKKKSLR